jgi:hypothetical protein
MLSTGFYTMNRFLENFYNCVFGANIEPALTKTGNLYGMAYCLSAGSLRAPGGLQVVLKGSAS